MRAPSCWSLVVPQPTPSGRTPPPEVGRVGLGPALMVASMVARCCLTWEPSSPFGLISSVSLSGGRGAGVGVVDVDVDVDVDPNSSVEHTDANGLSKAAFFLEVRTTISSRVKARMVSGSS